MQYGMWFSTSHTAPFFFLYELYFKCTKVHYIHIVVQQHEALHCCTVPCDSVQCAVIKCTMLQRSSRLHCSVKIIVAGKHCTVWIQPKLQTSTVSRINSFCHDFTMSCTLIRGAVLYPTINMLIWFLQWLPILPPCATRCRYNLPFHASMTDTGTLITGGLPQLWWVGCPAHFLCHHCDHSCGFRPAPLYGAGEGWFFFFWFSHFRCF